MFGASLARCSCSSQDQSANHLQTRSCRSGCCSRSHALAFSPGFGGFNPCQRVLCGHGAPCCSRQRWQIWVCCGGGVQALLPSAPPGCAAPYGAQFAGRGAAVQSPSPAGASPAARSGFSHPPASSNCGEVQLLFFFLCTQHVFPISELAWRLEDVVAEPCTDPAPPAAASAGRVLVAHLGPALAVATARGPSCPAQVFPPAAGSPLVEGDGNRLRVKLLVAERGTNPAGCKKSMGKVASLKSRGSGSPSAPCEAPLTVLIAPTCSPCTAHKPWVPVLQQGQEL